MGADHGMTIQRPTIAFPSIPVYTGPSVPTAYDSSWQLYTNLTPAQIDWFQAQPEWQSFIEWIALSSATATINAMVSEATISAALAAAQSKPPVIGPTPQ